MPQNTQSLETREMSEQILTLLTEVRAEQGKALGRLDGISEHLARLNGTVARHEQAINDQKNTCEKRQLLGDQVPVLSARIDTLEKSVWAHHQEAEVDAKWMRMLRPVLFTALGAGAVLMLQHAPELLRYFIR